MFSDHSPLPISSASHTYPDDKSTLPAPKRLGSWPCHPRPPVKSSLRDDKTQARTLQMSDPPPADKPGQSSSSRRRSAGSPASPPPGRGKRRRPPDMSDEEDVDRSPSPSPSELSSQGGAQETGPALSAGHHMDTSTVSALPVKKKRTRTLTTPHQSAVLHSLLAQVTFLMFDRSPG